MFLLRSIKADLYPNMNNSDGVDFSECRYEEDLVISFFDAHVYFKVSSKGTLCYITRQFNQVSCNVHNSIIT